jgi:hypothetical protein
MYVLLFCWEIWQQSLIHGSQDLRISLKQSIRIAPSQTRVVPFTIDQTAPTESQELIVKLTLESEQGDETEIIVSFPITHHGFPSSFSNAAIKGSYFYGHSIPTAFYAIPPKYAHDGKSHHPLLALRSSLFVGAHLDRRG